MDEEKLIVEVKNRSIIYDSSHRFYKYNYKKEIAWKDIADTVGVDADTCKTRWRALRDAFVKHRKKVSSGGRHPMEWKFNDTMAFLVPHLQPKRTRRTWGSVTAREETSVAALSICGSEEQASCSSEMQKPPSSSSVPSPSQPTPAGERDRPRRCRSPRERSSPCPTASETRRRAPTSDAEERQEPPPKLESELDECYHFALSLVPLLRRFDHSNRQHAKIGILNLLSNLESSTFT